MAPSGIHGHGLFAERGFRRGQRVGRYAGRTAARNGDHVLWVETASGWKGIHGENVMRFVNHSRRPNAEFRGADVVALRLIRPGEEITVHYGDDWEDVG